MSGAAPLSSAQFPALRALLLNASAARPTTATDLRRLASGLSEDVQRDLVAEFASLAAAVPSTRRKQALRAVESALSRQRSATTRMNEALVTAKRRLIEPVTAMSIPPEVRSALDIPGAADRVDQRNVDEYGVRSSLQRSMRAFLSRLLGARDHVLKSLRAAREARGAEIWLGFTGSRREALELGDGGRIEQIDAARQRQVERMDIEIANLEAQLDTVGSMCRFMRQFCTHDLTLRLKDPFRLLGLVGVFRILRMNPTRSWGPARFTWNVADRVKDVPLLWWRIRSPDRTWDPLTWLPRLPADLGVFGQLGGAIAVPPIAQLGLWGLVDRAERCPETGQRVKTLESGVAFDMSIPLRVSFGWMPKRWYKNRKQIDPTRREDVCTYGTGAPFFDVAQDAFIGTKAEVFVAGHFYISIFRRPDGSSGVNVGILPKNLATIPGVGEVLSALAESYGIPGEWQRVVAELPFELPDQELALAAAQLVFKPWFGVCIRHPVLGRPLHPPIALLQGVFSFVGMGWRLGVSIVCAPWRAMMGQQWKLVTPTRETTRQGLSCAFMPFKTEWYDWATKGLRELWNTNPALSENGKVVVEGPGLMGLAVAHKLRRGNDMLCFVSSDRKRVEALQGRYRYDVTRTPGTVAREVRNVEAVCTSNVDACANAYREALRVVVTLHPHAITDPATGRAGKRMAPIAAALAGRFRDPGAEPLLFILISNDRDSDSVFMTALREAIETECGCRHELKERIHRRIRVSCSVVEQRAQGIAGVCSASGVHSLVETEPDMEIILERAWCFDRHGKRSGQTDCADPLDEIQGVRMVDNFTAYKDRKLFASNGGHLYVAIHAFIAGLKTIDQGMADKDIRVGFEKFLDQEIYPSLQARYPGVFSDEEIARHRAMLMRRFSDSAFADDIVRVGRNIQMKLGVNERLTGSLINCLNLGIDAPELERTIAAALHFSVINVDDPEVAELQLRLMKDGPEKTLSALTGLASQRGKLKQPAVRALHVIVGEYHRIVSRRVEAMGLCVKSDGSVIPSRGFRPVRQRMDITVVRCARMRRGVDPVVDGCVPYFPKHHADSAFDGLTREAARESLSSSGPAQAEHVAVQILKEQIRGKRPWFDKIIVGGEIVRDADGSVSGVVGSEAELVTANAYLVLLHAWQEGGEPRRRLCDALGKTKFPWERYDLGRESSVVRMVDSERVDVLELLSPRNPGTMEKYRCLGVGARHARCRRPGNDAVSVSPVGGESLARVLLRVDKVLRKLNAADPRRVGDSIERACLFVDPLIHRMVVMLAGQPEAARSGSIVVAPATVDELPATVLHRPAPLADSHPSKATSEPKSVGEDTHSTSGWPRLSIATVVSQWLAQREVPGILMRTGAIGAAALAMGAIAVSGAYVDTKLPVTGGFRNSTPSAAPLATPLAASISATASEDPSLVLGPALATSTSLAWADGTVHEPKTTPAVGSIPKQRQRAIPVRRAAEGRRGASTEQARRVGSVSDLRRNVSMLLRRAEADVAALRLTTPPGNNAWERYTKVLSLDPDNARAQEGLRTIMSRYLELAAEAESTGRLRQAAVLSNKARMILLGASHAEL